MNIVLLLIIIVCLSMQTVTKKAYNKKAVENGKYFFSTMISLGALLFFSVSAKEFSFDVRILPYAALFAAFYGAATICNFIAIACGLMSVTALIISYSLMIPTLYGLLFLKESAGIGLYAGIVFLIISLFLICEKKGGAKLSVKWVVSVFIAFFGNGMCSVIQKMQQLSFDGQYKNEFMIIALFLVTLLFAALSFVKERKRIKGCTKNGIAFGLSCGIFNGIVNLFVMILSARMPVSLMFPTISAGDVVLTYIISRVCFKEHLTSKQFFGFCFGVISVVFLNL